MKWNLTVTGDESEVETLERLTRVLRELDSPQPLESKYSPLKGYLDAQQRRGKQLLELSIEEVERIIDDQLPPSAYRHDSFWRDRQRNIGAHIVRAGWHIHTIQRDPEEHQIVQVTLHQGHRRCRKTKESD